MSAADKTPLIPPKVLAGLVDGEEVGFHGRVSAITTQAAPSHAGRPETADEVRASIVRALDGLALEDLRRARALLRELPYTVLLARCQAATREGVEPEGTPNFRTSPTSRRTSALAQLLGAVEALGELDGIPRRARGGVGKYLRGEGSGS